MGRGFWVDSRLKSSREAVVLDHDEGAEFSEALFELRVAAHEIQLV
jgi:hypothetical protein